LLIVGIEQFVDQQKVFVVSFTIPAFNMGARIPFELQAHNCRRIKKADFHRIEFGKSLLCRLTNSVI
jgi:hypothetical protein